jgi:hypothetical protein
MVVAATHSTSFTGSASVADLWASLPDSPRARDGVGDRPRRLALEAVQTTLDDDRPVAARIILPTHCTIAGVETVEEVARLPSDYPTLAGIEVGTTRRNVFGGAENVYRFRREDGSLRPLHEVGDARGDIATRHFLVRPRIGDGHDAPPSEFLTFWLLLWCLSELARYYPDTWVAALDPDSSPVAVALGEILDQALEAAPILIGSALRGPIDYYMQAEMERLRREAATQGGAAAIGEG